MSWEVDMRIDTVTGGAEMGSGTVSLLVSLILLPGGCRGCTGDVLGEHVAVLEVGVLSYLRPGTWRH